MVSQSPHLSITVLEWTGDKFLVYHISVLEQTQLGCHQGLFQLAGLVADVAFKVPQLGLLLTETPPDMVLEILDLAESILALGTGMRPVSIQVRPLKHLSSVYFSSQTAQVSLNQAKYNYAVA